MPGGGAIGLFGGTFDPPTLAHLVVAEWTRDALGLDEVWLMPARVNPHKQQRSSSAPELRLEMTRAAAGPYPYLVVRDDELRRFGPSYTVDTLRQLRDEHPGHEFTLIVGGDSLHSLPRWKDYSDILRLARIAAVLRPGYEIEQAPVELRNRIATVEIPALDISATLVRERIASGRTVRGIVPDPVIEIIERNHLYQQHA